MLCWGKPEIVNGFALHTPKRTIIEDASTEVHCYAKEGPRNSFSFLTVFQGLKLVFHRWDLAKGTGVDQTQQPRAVVVGVHGITSHTRFEWLRHQAVHGPLTTTKEGGDYGIKRDLAYSGSWIEQLNEMGIVFYGLDQQGHGDSEGWEGKRCDVRQFEDFSVDLLQFLHIVNNEVNNATAEVPIFLMCSSMGGCVGLHALRMLEEDLLTVSKQKGNEPAWVRGGDPVALSSQIKGCVLLAPMLCVETILAQPKNVILSKFEGFVMRFMPELRAVELPKNPKFPHLEEDKVHDPLTFHGNIPSRIGIYSKSAAVSSLEASVTIGSPVAGSIRAAPPAFLIFHSPEDTMCDSVGSERLMTKLSFVTDKRLHLVPQFWHCISVEPGNETVVEIVKSWMYHRFTVPVATPPPKKKGKSKATGEAPAAVATPVLKEGAATPRELFSSRAANTPVSTPRAARGEIAIPGSLLLPNSSTHVM